MRKLTVKNFSVIKEAELEFGKITVLIGPQSSGKSLLCKLAFFFSQVVPEIDYAALSEPDIRPRSQKTAQSLYESFDRFRISLLHEFSERFPKSTWSGQAFEISYTSKQFDVTVESKGADGNPIFEFNSGFSERYGKPLQISSVPAGSMNAIDSRWIEERILDGPLRQEHSVYIPTGRAFFSTPNKGFASFSGKNLDWITQRFSTEIDNSYHDLIESSDPVSYLLGDFRKQATDILCGTVVKRGEIPYFRSFSSERDLPFELLSSGTLELLPLLNPFSIKVAHARFPDVPTTQTPRFGTIYVEEPESSVFPNTLYNLVRLFAWLANESAFNLSLAITTHSPYTLSSFNNLIEAGQVAKAKPALKSVIAKLIPEQYWIKEGDFKAYAIEDGILRSIVAEDTGLVSANYLDQVSETIGMEFDELLRLGYVES